MRERNGATWNGWLEPALWAGLVAAVRLAYALHSQISYDDAYISLRYAANLASGHGLVYNPGERIFGASTPLYVLLLALFARAGLPMPLFAGPAPLAWAKAASILAEGTTAAIWYRLLHQATGSPWPGRFFVLLFGLSPFIVETTISGMETSLVLLGMTLALTGAGLGEAPGAPQRPSAAVRLSFCLGVLALIRLDTLLFSAVLLAFRARWSRRTPWREIVVAVACMAPWYLFAWAYYGNPIPNSIFAKAAAYNEHLRSFSRPARTLGLHIAPYHSGFGADGFKLASFVLCVAGVCRLPSYPRLTVLLVYGALYAAFLILPHTLLFRWYLPPALMAVYALAALGAIALLPEGVSRKTKDIANCKLQIANCKFEGRSPGATSCRSRITLRRPHEAFNLQFAICSLQFAMSFRLLPAALWLLLAAHTTVWSARVADRARRLQWAEDHIRRDIGLWLNRHTPADARVATEALGYIGYYSRRRILDEVGLVTPRMIPLNRAGDGWFGTMLRAERPEYVVERYYYLARNETLLTGVRMFATETDRDWFEREYLPVKYYCWDLTQRLKLSSQTARDYAFIIFARRDLAVSRVADKRARDRRGAPRTGG